MALHNVKVKTAVGELEFDEIGELKVAPSFLYKVEGTKFVLAGQKYPPLRRRAGKTGRQRRRATGVTCQTGRRTRILPS